MSAIGSVFPSYEFQESWSLDSSDDDTFPRSPDIRTQDAYQRWVSQRVFDAQIAVLELSETRDD